MTKLDFSTRITTLTGKDTDLSAYENKVLLVVNTASKCGLTPQFEGLQALYEAHEQDGLEILGFPCNQFAGQEPGDSDEIGAFCVKNYGVRFPMHAKVDVNGKNTHPLFEQLKTAAKGLAGSKSIKWNFTKFLIGRDGEIITRFAPKTAPAKIESDIKAALAKS